MGWCSSPSTRGVKSLFCTGWFQCLENARGRVGLAAAVGRVQDTVGAAIPVGQARSRSGPPAVSAAALVAPERAAGKNPKERERGHGKGGAGQPFNYQKPELLRAPPLGHGVQSSARISLWLHYKK